MEHQTLLQQKNLLDQVVPVELYDNNIQQDCYVVTDAALGNSAPHHLFLARKGGQPVAAALETTAPDGYSGAIQMLVGADFQGKVLGVRVIEHHETPGLGIRSNCVSLTGSTALMAKWFMVRRIKLLRLKRWR